MEKVDITIQQFHINNTLYKYNFVATSPTTELKFFYRANYANLTLDDVSVKPVPEPLTLGGTAVAGLMGIWLKRKQVASHTRVQDAVEAHTTSCCYSVHAAWKKSSSQSIA
jgi:hypothetical protein